MKRFQINDEFVAYNLAWVRALPKGCNRFFYYSSIKEDLLWDESKGKDWDFAGFSATPRANIVAITADLEIILRLKYVIPDNRVDS